MKILIVSDTHRYLGNLQTALEEEGPVDMLIHLGDIEHQMADVIRMAGCPVHMIAGNNDFLCNLPEEEEFEIGSYHVWITHGHRYGVSFDTEEIKEEATDTWRRYRNVWSYASSASGGRGRSYHIESG